jgi:hypothetical protein
MAKKKKAKKKRKCQHKVKIFDRQTGETYCQECGTVLEEEVAEQAFRDPEMSQHKPTSLLDIFDGLGTHISRADRFKIKKKGRLAEQKLKDEKPDKKPKPRKTKAGKTKKKPKATKKSKKRKK